MLVDGNTKVTIESVNIATGERKIIDDLYWFEENGIHDFDGIGNLDKFKFIIKFGEREVMGKKIDLEDELDALVKETKAGVEIGSIDMGTGIMITMLSQMMTMMSMTINKIEDSNELFSEVLEVLGDILETKNGCTKVEEGD